MLPLACSAQASAADADPYAAQRQALMREIERDVRETASYLKRRKLDEQVMAAMASLRALEVGADPATTSWTPQI